MARAELSYNYSNNGRGGAPKWCYYKRTTVIICSFNIAIAFYVFHNLYSSIYSYPYQDLHNGVSYPPDQIRNMEESVRIRIESKPVKLMEMVKKIKKHFNKEEAIKLPQPLKQKLTNELLEVLSVVNASSNTTLQHEAIQQWRKQKLEEAKRLKHGKTSNSTILIEEAGILAKLLELKWAELLDQIGLWIPINVTTNEHNDKPEGEEDFDDKILAGRRLPPECNVEHHTDYGGQAVKWGLTHHKESAYDCCQACLDHAKNAKPDQIKCNIWVYCPVEEGCHSPDIYQHKLQECWLKYDEKPKVNFKDMYSESYRSRYPDAPIFVPWVSGVISRIEMEIGGLDSNGREFKSADEMWREEVGDSQKKLDWYRNGVGYWQGVDASVDGVLGGYAHVNEPDIKASEAFLNTLLTELVPNGGRNQHLVALDCGSGIGRVTKNLLIRYFNEVDLLEPVSHFLEAARENLAPENLSVSEEHKASNFYCTPLQEFTPDTQRYDVIWVQWCIGHLADDDFVSFFKRAKAGLKPGGFFVLKENLAKSGFVLDNEDKSITRSDVYFKELFNQCGLNIYKLKDQKGFPDELFAVRMYALTTETLKKVGGSRPKRKANRPAIIK